MIDLLYPIANLTGKRLEIFNEVLRAVDRNVFNIKIIDTGQQPSMDTARNGYYWHAHPLPYNKSFAINLGVKMLIHTEDFCVCDADVMFIHNQHHITDADVGEFYLERPKILVDFKDKTWLIEHSLGAGKCFLTNLHTFNTLKGFDEHYIGYGHEDVDFAVRYYLLTHEPYDFVNTLAVHIDHDDKNQVAMSVGEQRNLMYFQEKFNSKEDTKLLNNIYREIRERKNETNSWTMCP